MPSLVPSPQVDLSTDHTQYPYMYRVRSKDFGAFCVIYQISGLVTQQIQKKIHDPTKHKVGMLKLVTVYAHQRVLMVVACNHCNA